MAYLPNHLRYSWSRVTGEDLEVGVVYKDGFLYLNDDPGVWIESNPDIVSSVRSLELYLMWYKGERIGDSIGALSQLTHLFIDGKRYLKCLPNTLSRLHNLHHLELYECDQLEELPATLGDLYNLTSLSLESCENLKSIQSVAKLSNLTTLLISDCWKLEELPGNLGDLYSLKSLCLMECKYLFAIQSVAKLSNLTTLFISSCWNLEELPANLGDLKFLASLFLYGCNSLKYLPWSITKLSKLQHLYLPQKFRVETLPPHLNDSIIISVENTHIRKTWKELKNHMTETLSIQSPIITEELVVELDLKTSTPGYLQFTGDITPWIRDNKDLQSSVQILDLDLLNDEDQLDFIPDSIGELPLLTHLYITNVCLPRHLPPTFTRLTHLSLINCTFEFDAVSHIDSLGKLSTLTSLHLNLKWHEELPKHIDLPISLTHLSLECCYSSIPDSFMASMAKLSNLNTLTLFRCGDLESLPLHLNLTKLILRETTIQSLPIGLKHLEIIHGTSADESCNNFQECWRNQLVNLETLSYTYSEIKSLLSLTSLHNLRELQLKDCFSLKELPQDLHKLVKLCTLDVSGTRIQYLPSSIINLYNLQCLILPKCFILKSLPDDFGNKVMISVDDTDERYYKDQGYHDQDYEIIKDCDYMTSDSINEINEKFLELFKQATVIEQASPHRPSNHQPDATRIIEGCHFIGSTDPSTNNNPNAFISSPNHEIENLPTSNAAGTMPVVFNECCSDVNANTMQDHDPTIDIEGNNNAVGENSSHAIVQYDNRDGVVTDIAAEPISNNLHETNTVGLSNQQVFQTERIDNTLELEQGNSSCGRRGSLKGQDNIAQRGGVQHNTQKKRENISLERINELKSQNLTLGAAASKEHLGVSRSTLKRRLKELGITWSSKEKEMNPDTNETYSTCERNLSQPNSIDASNPASHGQGVENLAGSSQPTLSSHVPSEHNVVNNSTPDVVTTTVGEPLLSTQYCVDSHQQVEEHPNDGVREPALVNTLVNTDLPPNERCSTFVVKATFNEDTARFNFSLSSSIEKLKEEVGKSLDLEVGTFKIRYLDDEKEWMLMNRISDLELALNLSRASGSNVVRLSISLKT